jgi:hypothetical protein
VEKPPKSSKKVVNMTNQVLGGFSILGQMSSSPNKERIKMESEIKVSRNGFLEFASKVHQAKLESRCKVLLWHYAYAYNWKKGLASFYTQEQICALTSMSPSTYQKTRKKLLSLGWIQESKHGWDLPVFVVPKIGKSDPGYEKYSWAKGHKENKMTIEEALRSLPDEFRDPFGK